MACKKLLAVDRSSSRTAFCRGSRCLFTVVTCQIKTFTLRGGWVLKLKACAYGVMCLCKTRTIRSEIGAELACAASECLVLHRTTCWTILFRTSWTSKNSKITPKWSLTVIRFSYIRVVQMSAMLHVFGLLFSHLTVLLIFTCSFSW